MMHSPTAPTDYPLPTQFEKWLETAAPDMWEDDKHMVQAMRIAFNAGMRAAFRQAQEEI